MITFWIGFFLAAFGVAWAVGHSRASRGLREWIFERTPLFVDLLECPGCLGFYLGFAFGLWELHTFTGALFLGFATVGSNVILGRLTGVMPTES